MISSLRNAPAAAVMADLVGVAILGVILMALLWLPTLAAM